MTVMSKVAIEQLHTTEGRGVRRSAAQVGRFILHLLEMTLAMALGMPLLYVLELLTPESSRLSAAFEFGTNPFDLAMGVAMTVPMVVWMLARGHGRRHSAEMALAMLAPVAAIILLRQAGAEAYLSWLDYASHGVMLPAMLAVMLYRRDHFTGKSGNPAHTAHHADH